MPWRAIEKASLRSERGQGLPRWNYEGLIFISVRAQVTAPLCTLAAFVLEPRLFVFSRSTQVSARKYARRAELQGSYNFWLLVIFGYILARTHCTR